jgi:acyl-CoA dehydrogenase
MGIISPKSDAITTHSDLLVKIHHIGEEVIRPAAASVDSEARFPHEALEALRKERLLAAYIPREYGGLAYTVSELAAIAQTLAQYCASTAMIWAMHQIQIACIVEYEQSSPFFQTYLREVAEQQLLLASITSEVGIGGDLRSSIAAIVPAPESVGIVQTYGARPQAGQGPALSAADPNYILEKKATTLSYGAHADGFLATARRSPDAVAGDQVLVLLRRSDTQLTQTGTWNTFGMRGTCSPSFDVSSSFPAQHVFTTPFADIATQTMVPFSHLLWSACWQGIATDALARARKFLQGKARQQRATSVPGDARLVQASGLLQLMRSNLNETISEYEQRLQDQENREESLSDMGFAIKLNHVKTLSSELVVQIVQQALYICGMAGYKEDSPLSVTRHLRDAYSAGLMINNDRLNMTNAALLLVHKESQSLTGLL